MNKILSQIPKATLIIITFSITIPLLLQTFPKLQQLSTIKYNYLFIISLLISIFKSEFSLQLLITCFFRLQILLSIENVTKDEVEIIYYTFTSFITLMLGFYFEKIQTFSDSLNLMYTVMLSQLHDQFNVFGFIIKGTYLPFIHLIIDFVVNNGNTKSYYGVIHGLIYFYMKSKGFGVPKFFEVFYRKMKERFVLTMKPKLKGKRLGKRK